MSFNNGEMHAVAMVSAVVLTAGLTVLTLWGTRAADADVTPPLEEMEVIEASIAYKKADKKVTQPQKQTRPPDPVVKPEGVSRDDKKKPPEEKPPKPEEEKPVTNPDPAGKPVTNPNDMVGDTEPVGAFNGEEYGVGDVTKGDPYFARLSRDLGWQPPELARGSSEPIGCVQILSDGKIPQIKFKETSDDDLGSLAETALRSLQQKRNRDPEEVPTHLLKALTTKWICFKFTVKPPE